jgi:ribosome-associated heat shock protein Hsp15
LVAEGRIRLDKWLWQARFFKTRGLSVSQVEAGHVRINGEKTRKPGHGLAPGDVVTFLQGDLVRVVRVLDIGTRRGPASEAQGLYRDEGGQTPAPLE